MFQPTHQTLRLTPERIALLKSYFREDNMTWIESAYGGKRFAFKIPYDELKEKDAELAQNDPNAFGSAMLVNYMNFIMRCNPVDPAFVAQYIKKPWQLSIFKSCFFDYEKTDLDGEVDAEGNDSMEWVLTLGYKRPFGNSNVIEDVLDEMSTKERANAKRRDPDTVINEAVVAVLNYLIHGWFDPRLEATSRNFSRYELTPAYLREDELENFGI